MIHQEVRGAVLRPMLVLWLPVVAVLLKVALDADRHNPLNAPALKPLQRAGGSPAWICPPACASQMRRCRIQRDEEIAHILERHSRLVFLVDNQVRASPSVSNTAKETASRITETAIDLSRFVWDAM